MTEEEMSEMFGGGDSPFSDFFQTFFGGGGGGAQRRRASRRTRPDAPAEGPRRRARVRAGSRIGRARQRAAAGAAARRRGAQRRGAHSAPGVVDGSLVRVAGEGGRGTGGAAERRPVPAHQAEAASRVQVSGRDLTTRVTRPGVDRRARRRSRRGHARRQDGAHEGAGDQPAGAQAPPARHGAAGARRARGRRAISTSWSTWRSPAL